MQSPSSVKMLRLVLTFLGDVDWVAGKQIKEKVLAQWDFQDDAIRTCGGGGVRGESCSQVLLRTVYLSGGKFKVRDRDIRH